MSTQTAPASSLTLCTHCHRVYILFVYDEGLETNVLCALRMNGKQCSCPLSSNVKDYVAKEKVIITATTIKNKQLKNTAIKRARYNVAPTPPTGVWAKVVWVISVQDCCRKCYLFSPLLLCETNLTVPCCLQQKQIKNKTEHIFSVVA